jgi:hypothetical protein
VSEMCVARGMREIMGSGRLLHTAVSLPTMSRR